MAERIRIALAALLLVACGDRDAGDSPPADFAPPSAAETVGVSGRELEATLPLLLTSTIQRLDRVGDEAAAGTARILRADADGALTLTIELNQVNPGSHGWEIRQGDCVASTDTSRTSPASRTAGVTGTVDVSDAGFGEASAMLPEAALAAEDVGRSRYSLVVLGVPRAEGPPGVVACADL